MNIIDALKTMKPIRRPIERHIGSNKSGWLDRYYVLNILDPDGRDGWAKRYPSMLTIQDIMADDWVCKEEDE